MCTIELLIFPSKGPHFHAHAAYSRPYPVTASAYVELQQQLLQRFADDTKVSGLTPSEQIDWLREVCDSAAGDWAACVDDILTTARRVASMFCPL
jgi:hypothetical protein